MNNIFLQNGKCNPHAVVIFGKEWSSISACCKFYQVNYRSVIGYKYKNRSTNDEAITHYIQFNNQKEFRFKGKFWTTLKTCCEYHCLNYKAFLAFKYLHNYDNITALQVYYKFIYNRAFKFQYVKYNSFEACCKSLGVSPSGVKKYARKKKFLLHHALRSYIHSKEKKKFPYENKLYPSFAECCRNFDLNVCTVNSYARRHKISKQHALDHYLIGIIFRNVKYKSLEECCEKFNINPASVKSFVYRGAGSIEEAIEHLINYKFAFQGREFPNFKVCCRHYQFHPSKVKHYIRYHSVTKQEALQICIDKRSNGSQNAQKEFVFRGKEYKTIKACCKIYNINSKSVSAYKFRNNCSDQEAIEHLILFKDKRKFVWLDGKSYKSMKYFCELTGISNHAVRTRSERCGESWQMSALHYLLLKDPDTYAKYKKL